MHVSQSVNGTNMTGPFDTLEQESTSSYAKGRDMHDKHLSNTLQDLPAMASAKQCEATTGVPERTLRRMLNAGTIKGVRVGRKWYVNTAELAKYLGLA